jgi:hypothetical protein
MTTITTCIAVGQNALCTTITSCGQFFTPPTPPQPSTTSTSAAAPTQTHHCLTFNLESSNEFTTDWFATVTDNGDYVCNNVHVGPTKNDNPTFDCGKGYFLRINSSNPQLSYLKVWYTSPETNGKCILKSLSRTIQITIAKVSFQNENRLKICYFQRTTLTEYSGTTNPVNCQTITWETPGTILVLLKFDFMTRGARLLGAGQGSSRIRSKGRNRTC